MDVLDPLVIEANGSEKITSGSAVTTSDCATGVAARWFASPAWLAVITVVPVPTTVTTLPVTVATAGSELA